jgi:hypothetical protein
MLKCPVVVVGQLLLFCELLVKSCCDLAGLHSTFNEGWYDV